MADSDDQNDSIKERIQTVLRNQEHGMKLELGKKAQFVDCTAEREIELVFGSDAIMRINIDGTCVMRVRQVGDCITTIRGMPVDRPASTVMLNNRDE